MEMPSRATNSVAITIVKFWTNYVPNPDGTMRAVDMCAYAPMGRVDRAVNVETVTRLSKVHPDDKVAENPQSAMAFAAARWKAIEPAYRRWKDGQEIPLHGTPLGAWPGITAEQTDVLKAMGIRTVEEFAEMSDGLVSRCNFPGPRALQQMARDWLKGADRQRAAAEMNSLKAENETMREQLEEMKRMLIEMQGQKRGPGRPRKIETDADESEAAA